MKCDNCPAFWETNTENGYEGGCYLEGLIDSKYDYVDGGCTIHYKTVKKLMDEHEQWTLLLNGLGRSLASHTVGEYRP